MARKRITNRTVDALKPGDLIWDTDVKGFGVRCQREAKVYVLKKRVRGRSRWFTIGRHGSPWTPKSAKKEAERILGGIADGEDPAAVRTAERNKVTVSGLCDRYLEDYAKEHKRPSSYQMDKANIENHVKPLLGNLFVVDVTLGDIDKFKRDVKVGKSARPRKEGQQGGSSVTGGPGVANRCIALLSKMFNLAERWGIRNAGSNPCRNIDKYKENKREKFLSDKELAQLGEVLAQADSNGTETPYSIAAIRLLIFTGARRGEILTLEWDHVDFDRAMMFLPESKTGQKVVYLSAPALETLASVPRLENNPYVICGLKFAAHLVNLAKPWGRISKAANLKGVRLHDLRHSFASIAASGGLSLPMIGKLLGHTQSATTQRYAHLAADPVRAANEAIGQRIAATMRGGEDGEANVVPIAKRTP